MVQAPINFLVGAYFITQKIRWIILKIVLFMGKEVSAFSKQN